MTTATRRASVDDLAPPAERQVRGHPDRGLLLAFGEHLEQQLGAAGVELDVADLIDQEQVDRGGSGTLAPAIARARTASG